MFSKDDSLNYQPLLASNIIGAQRDKGMGVSDLIGHRYVTPISIGFLHPYLRLLSSVLRVFALLSLKSNHLLFPGENRNSP